MCCIVKRDLGKDLELTNRATPGPWKFHEVEFQCGRDECPYEKKREDNSCLKCDGVEIYQSAFVPEVLTLGCGEYDGMNDADAEFIAQAREGWPYAIERAIEAEELNRELIDVLDVVLSEDSIPMSKWLESKEQLKVLHAKAKEVLGDE
jgi:hypothetical protein